MKSEKKQEIGTLLPVGFFSQGRADRAVGPWTTFSRSAGIGLCDIHCEADFLIKKESSLRRTFWNHFCLSFEKAKISPFGGL